MLPLKCLKVLFRGVKFLKRYWTWVVSQTRSCFSFSASLDDVTHYTFINRSWNAIKIESFLICCVANSVSPETSRSTFWLLSLPRGASSGEIKIQTLPSLDASLVSVAATFGLWRCWNVERPLCNHDLVLDHMHPLDHMHAHFQR